jgi:16S rRNA (guanine1516-N2)-methyltransferase
LQQQAKAADLAIVAASGADEAAAAQLQRRLALPLLPSGTDPASCEAFQALLLVRDQVLSVQQTGRDAPGPVQVDFDSARTRYRSRTGAHELLGRAVGCGKKQALRVLDATAGLGRDAFVLADLGCTVQLCEREPVIAELLRSGLHRAAQADDPWLCSVVQRLTLCEGDVRELQLESHAVDVVCLDPMYPRRNKSAAVKKEMVLFQSLLANNAADDADSLLHWALEQDVARVVVKRPPKSPHLAAVQPSHSIVGKAVRYDVYVRRKLG